ncbi:TonB-dependent receptor [Sphingomonadaceae bacterium OTU29MARTA1]|nr:TonB-dependent receptor [Sphingomonadaceae bacterium OTU29MARTA1]
MRMTFACGVAFAALMIPGAAFAQSTASSEVDEEIVVTGSRGPTDIEGIRSPEGTKARAVITNELINRQAPGNTVLESLNLVPGVNFTNNDPFGSSGGNIRIRGFDGNRISLTFDGFPLNDTGNYAIYSNQQLDPELIDEVNVNLGATDIDSPTASAAGGTINYRTIIPSDEISATGSFSYGDFNFLRAFGLIETGKLTSFGTKAFISASTARNDKFKGPGRVVKQQFNGGIYQPLGDNGDFVRISGHYNKNRNNFYRNPTVADLRTALGTALIPATGSPDNPLVIASDLNDAQRDIVNGIERDRFSSTGYGFNTSQNYYGLYINPSNTANVRANSRYTINDQFTFYVDAGYQYTLANGGGSTTILENALRVRGGTPTSPGVDYNGDGDFTDTVRFYTPNNTNTRRWTATASLRWKPTDDQTFRLAYTYDRGRHRQTGDWSYLDLAGNPESPFGGRNARPVLTADGFQFQQRDRLSIALLNQISGEYIGKFFDDRFTVQAGIRAPFFKRDLNQYCYTEARGSSGFGYCTSELASSLRIVAPGAVIPATGGATPYYAPFKQQYKFDALLPSAGFTYRVDDTFSAFGSYAKGFSAPRTDNLYRTPIVNITPEKTDSFDLGIRASSRFIQGQLTGWYIRYTNRIVTSFDQDQGISVDRNVGSVDSYGVDLGVTVRPVRWLAVTALANYIESELKQNIQVGGTTAAPIFALTAGKEVVETPKWQVGGRAQLTFGPLDIGLQGKWVDKRYATDTNDVVVPSYTLFDLDTRLSLQPLGLEKTYLQLNVKNLFNEFYYGSISSQINAFAASCTATCSTSLPNFAVGYPRTFIGSVHFQF